MNFVQQHQFRPSPLPKQHSPYVTNISVASTLIQIKSVENSPNSKTNPTLTFNSPESPTMRLGGNIFTNSSRAQLWTLALYNNKNGSFLTRSDKDIELVSLDLPNQNVINNDCMRTRVNSFTPNLRGNLEKLLTCYCKRENITYKQGLHELAAPFILFLESGISLSETYNLFSLFIDRFLPSFYTDQDFLSLQCCQRALSLLLKYHDPALHAFLTSNYFTPEIFSTPWFITLFASKLELNIVYLLWDLYLVEQDPYFVFFFAVGLLIENKNNIMNASISIVPEILSNLTIENREQLKQIYKRAKTLKLNTLQSFTYKLEELEILKRGHAQDKNYKSKLHQSLDYLENLTHMVLSPYELLEALYPVELGCSNPTCGSLTGNKNNMSPSRKDSFQAIDMNRASDSESPFLCTSCVTKSSSSSRFILEKSMPHLSDILKEKGSYQIQDGSQTYHINFVIMDLRASKEIGYLPRSHLIEPSRLKSGAINQLIDEFARLKGQSHFILLTSKLDNSFFSQRKSEESELSGHRSQVNVADENSLAAQFLAALTKKGFPFLSIVEGGFQKVNQILNKRSIDLLKSTPWAPNKPIFKIDSVASTEPYYMSTSPKTGSPYDFRSTYNDIPSLQSNASKNFDGNQENLQSPTSPFLRPKTPTPSSAVFISARQEPVENNLEIQAQRSRSTLKNQRKIDQPLNSKIDFHTPKTPETFQTKMGFSGQYELAQSRASTEASPEKVRLKNALSTPAFLANQGITSALRTISSPGAMGTGFISPKMKDNLGYEENPIRASREIFSQQKSKLVAHKDSSDEPGSAGLPAPSQSPLVMDSNYQKSSRSAIVSPSYNTPSQNSPTHVAYRDPLKAALPRGTQIPITDFSSMVRLQSSTGINNNFGELGSGKVQINNFERDQDFTKSAYANKETNSIGDYMNDRKYFNGNGGDLGNSRLASDRDSRNTSVYSAQDYKYSSFAQANETRLSREAMTPEQKSTMLQIPRDYREFKDFTLDNNSREDEGDRRNSTSPMVKRGQKSMTSAPQRAYGSMMITKSGSGSGKVQNGGDNRQLYDVAHPERAIIMANEMLRKKEESTGEKPKKRESESGMSPSKVDYYPESSFQKQYHSGSGIINSYLSQQHNSASSSKRSTIMSYGSQSTRATVLSPRAMLPDDELHFYKYFQKKSFTLYICEHLQRVAEDRGSPDDGAHVKSILVISQELVVTVQFNQNIFQKLILLQKGVPASQLIQTYQKHGNFATQSLAVGQFSKEMQRDLTISSVIPLRLLLKVTSKKADPKFISIYFKFPKVDEDCFRKFYRMFDMTNMTLEELFRAAENKEFEYILDEVRGHKDEKKFTEIKSVYRLENEETAQKCILRVKEAYKKYPTNY